MIFWGCVRGRVVIFRDPILNMGEHLEQSASAQQQSPQRHAPLAQGARVNDTRQPACGTTSIRASRASTRGSRSRGAWTVQAMAPVVGVEAPETRKLSRFFCMVLFWGCVRGRVGQFPADPHYFGGAFADESSFSATPSWNIEEHLEQSASAQQQSPQRHTPLAQEQIQCPSAGSPPPRTAWSMSMP